jgi:hypothetical protein
VHSPLFPGTELAQLDELRSSSGASFPAGALPLFGAWAVDRSLVRFTKGSPRRGGGPLSLGWGLGYKRALAWVKKTASLTGLDPKKFGTHSLRRGGAIELQHAVVMSLS